MRQKLFSFIFIATVTFLIGCEKNDSLTKFQDGVTPVLSASSATIAPPPADSNKVVLTLNWTDPGHAQQKSLYKYYLEIDSSGRNFSKSTVINVENDKDKRQYSFLAKELNNILLSFGFDFNVTYSIDIRIVSSYGNNNEQKKSQPVKISVTPYKVPPKVTLPPDNRLFIVGNATDGGWENPVPEPSQELSRINETTYGGIFQLSGGNEYLLLPVNGSWSQKYAIKDEDLTSGSNVEGKLSFYDVGVDGGKNFPAPEQTGLYKITVDFQRGIYKVEPFTQQHGLPTDLFITGGATPGGWNNPVPVPDQQLTRKNSVEWDINLNFKAGEKYLLLPTNGSWDQKFGADNPDAPNSGLVGKIKPEGADIPAPANTGNYKFSVNFFTGMYSLSPQ
jgi:hypothetical protein